MNKYKGYSHYNTNMIKNDNSRPKQVATKLKNTNPSYQFYTYQFLAMKVFKQMATIAQIHFQQ